jgi:hypothetical protein
MKIKKYVSAISWPLRVILFFCLAGIIRNIYHMNLFDFNYGTIATKVFVAMLVIYAAQSVLILARESKVWLISALQAFFCYYVYEDFTFLPVVAMVKNITLYYLPDMNYGWISFLHVSCISALLSLEIFKTYLLFVLTNELPHRKPRAGKKAKAETAS